MMDRKVDLKLSDTNTRIILPMESHRHKSRERAKVM